MRIPTRQALQPRGGRIEFLTGFLRNPKEVGSVVPSSRFLTRRVLECGAVDKARMIVELGPGTGVFTGEILKRMRPNAKLVAVEINPTFVRMLRSNYPDPRLSVYEGSASDLEKALIEAGTSQADLVVSGIPFSTLAHETRRATLEAARRVLGPGGYFVAYQVRSHVRRFAEPVFGPGETHREFLNLPPMRIYVWQRPVGDA